MLFPTALSQKIFINEIELIEKSWRKISLHYGSHEKNSFMDGRKFHGNTEIVNYTVFQKNWYTKLILIT